MGMSPTLISKNIFFLKGTETNIIYNNHYHKNLIKNLFNI